MSLFKKGGPSKIKIKICGITRLSDILICQQLGIDAVGFLVKEDKPALPTDVLLSEEAKILVAQVPSPLVSVLLIKYTDYEKIEKLIDYVRPAAIQIQEDGISPEKVRRLRTHYKDIEIIRTIHISKEDDLEDIRQRISLYVDFVDAILLDSAEGGSGRVHDWKISAVVAGEVKAEGKAVVLAGGLNAGNLREAIETVQPDMVDIMSGARSEKGKINSVRVEKLSEVVNRINTMPYVEF